MVKSGIFYIEARFATPSSGTGMDLERADIAYNTFMYPNDITLDDIMLLVFGKAPEMRYFDVVGHSTHNRVVRANNAKKYEDPLAVVYADMENHGDGAALVNDTPMRRTPLHTTYTTATMF